jgi:hypothetical protein
MIEKARAVGSAMSAENGVAAAVNLIEKRFAQFASPVATIRDFSSKAR